MWGCGEGCFKRGQTPEAPQSHASQDGLDLELRWDKWWLRSGREDFQNKGRWMRHVPNITSPLQGLSGQGPASATWKHRMPCRPALPGRGWLRFSASLLWDPRGCGHFSLVRASTRLNPCDGPRRTAQWQTKTCCCECRGLYSIKHGGWE